jgi:hypothetical protein
LNKNRKGFKHLIQRSTLNSFKLAKYSTRSFSCRINFLFCLKKKFFLFQIINSINYFIYSNLLNSFSRSLKSRSRTAKIRLHSSSFNIDNAEALEVTDFNSIIHKKKDKEFYFRNLKKKIKNTYQIQTHLEVVT